MTFRCFSALDYCYKTSQIILLLLFQVCGLHHHNFCSRAVVSSAKLINSELYAKNFNIYYELIASFFSQPKQRILSIETLAKATLLFQKPSFKKLMYLIIKASFMYLGNIGENTKKPAVTSLFSTVFSK